MNTYLNAVKDEKKFNSGMLEVMVEIGGGERVGLLDFSYANYGKKNKLRKDFNKIPLTFELPNRCYKSLNAQTPHLHLPLP